MQQTESYRRRRLIKKSVLTFFMLCFTATMLLPYLWMVSSSFKDSVAMFDFPVKWIPLPPDFSGYKKVWLDTSGFLRFFFNSAKVVFFALCGTFLSCTMGGYAYAKIKFRGRDKFFMLCRARCCGITFKIYSTRRCGLPHASLCILSRRNFRGSSCAASR